MAAKFTSMPDGVRTVTDAINIMVEIINGLQEAVSSVSYPAIAVTPIALYHELSSLK